MVNSQKNLTLDRWKHSCRRNSKVCDNFGNQKKPSWHRFPEFLRPQMFN